MRLRREVTNKKKDFQQYGDMEGNLTIVYHGDHTYHWHHVLGMCVCKNVGKNPDRQT